MSALRGQIRPDYAHLVRSHAPRWTITRFCDGDLAKRAAPRLSVWHKIAYRTRMVQDIWSSLRCPEMSVRCH
jgi:hypothetical protein